MDTMCAQNPWATPFFRVLVHTLSERARPTRGLTIVSRVRRRDMARFFDSGEGSTVKRLGTASLDADDSLFCNAAVPGEDVRIGQEIESLLMSSLLRPSSRGCETRREKKQQYIGTA